MMQSDQRIVLGVLASVLIQVTILFGINRLNNLFDDNEADILPFPVEHVLQSSKVTRNLSILDHHLTTAVSCNSDQICLGQQCDFTCGASEISGGYEVVSQNGHSPTISFRLAPADSDGCRHWFPTSCGDCECVGKHPAFDHQRMFRKCEPCTFRKLGWIPRVQRQLLSPFEVPMFFPISCNVSLITNNQIMRVMEETMQGKGMWISMVGDSMLRGTFAEAVKSISHIRYWPLLEFNYSTYHLAHYFCCNSNYSIDSSQVQHMSGRFHDCELRRKDEDSNHVASGLPITIVTELQQRLKNHSGQVPICISWQWNRFTSTLIEVLNEYEVTYKETKVKPVSISLNPGLHVLTPKYDLDSEILGIEKIKEKCKYMFASNDSRGEGSGGRHCFLHTSTFTKLNRTEADLNEHKRTYSNINGYNAAISSAWFSHDWPIIDSGSLSLVPAIMNSVYADKIHFKGKSSFYLLNWQMILNSIMSQGTPICEKQ